MIGVVMLLGLMILVVIVVVIESDRNVLMKFRIVVSEIVIFGGIVCVEIVGVMVFVVL